MLQIWYISFMLVLMTFNALKVAGAHELSAEKDTQTAQCYYEQHANILDLFYGDTFVEEVGDGAGESMHHVVSCHNAVLHSFPVNDLVYHFFSRFSSFILFEADTSPPAVAIA
ncbi:hypothetical protein [Carboxylicivirga taeanensis]|uniref:hypothetical protein n=1 Tax=Carboxylicivirga taeanensis TaxID=1416875 RepID=UPI003F6E3374